MKKYKTILCIAIILVIGVMFSACKKQDSVDLTVEHFLTTFYTVSEDNPYEVYRQTQEKVTNIEDAQLMIDALLAFHSRVQEDMTEKGFEKLLANRLLLQLNKVIYEKNQTLQVKSVKITNKEETTMVKDGMNQTFEVGVDVLDDSGTVIQTSVQKGSLITVKDGDKTKIESYHFDNLQELVQK